MTKRVYKFLSAHNALDDLDRRRIKLSTIDELNDPFDLTAADTTDPAIEDAIEGIIIWFRKSKGLLCFSRNWDNILLWSHYAASHTGLCLGFDIPDTDAGYSQEVAYQPGLLPLLSPTDVTIEFANKLLRTKHEAWSYEQELRLFVQLNDLPDDKGLNWTDFGEDLDLKEIVVGVNCTPEHAARVVKLHRLYRGSVELTWAYLRKDAFSLVRMTSPPQWLLDEK